MFSLRAVVEAAAIFVLIVSVGLPLVWQVAGELGAASRPAPIVGVAAIGHAPTKPRRVPEPDGGQVVPVAEPDRTVRVRRQPVPASSTAGPEVEPVPWPTRSPWSPSPSPDDSEEPPPAEVVESPSPAAEVVTPSPGETPAVTAERGSAN
jgi:hypothetical protein